MANERSCCDQTDAQCQALGTEAEQRISTVRDTNDHRAFGGTQRRRRRRRYRPRATGGPRMMRKTTHFGGCFRSAVQYPDGRSGLGRARTSQRHERPESKRSGAERPSVTICLSFSVLDGNAYDGLLRDARRAVVVSSSSSPPSVAAIRRCVR